MSDVIDLTAAGRRMNGAVESVKSSFATIRTGRANPSLLDRIEVELYGSRMPLRSVANIGAPEARLLTVTPFDPNTLKEIERAIRDADIGLNPQNDGKILRLPIPELTEERRRDLIRMARSMAEEGRVAVRNVRRDEMRDLHELRKEGEISQDDEHRAEDELQKLTDDYVKRVESALADKEAELCVVLRSHPDQKRLPTDSPEQRVLDPERIPRHVAIIMDGNGRWAKRRWLPRAAGHRAGVSVLTPLLETAGRAGVKTLTLYAFSTENWARPEREVKTLMKLFLETAREKVPELNERGARLRFLGRRQHLPASVLEAMEEAEDLTSGNDSLDVYIALDYGGRAEIVDATRRIVADGLSPEDVDEMTFAGYLYAPDVPEVDLVIRTSGELRVSNFLLWQIAYAEFYVTDTLWPDFSPDEFLRALESFASRSRRRGGV
jgi:undecaprenyl diphosphate synthase